MTINDANSVYRQTKIFFCNKFTIISKQKKKRRTRKTKKTKKTMTNYEKIFLLFMNNYIIY